MKKTLTITLILLFAGASLFAQKPHHEKDKHKEIKKEYKHHHNHHNSHKNTTVVIQPTAPRPPSVNIQLPAPQPPPRPPK
jgi:hypothetical protein